VSPQLKGNNLNLIHSEVEENKEEEDEGEEDNSGIFGKEAL
jgi:hypothetical protein